ncbi:hypothetical protein [Longitalea arenae]|uniref:hypothetical protein n=1 Tax=Longitalea arenae TaxID=2812558 RepID=UPI001967E9FB|nr:hypothetical protein [Longitalea arenae]
MSTANLNEEELFKDKTAKKQHKQISAEQENASDEQGKENDIIHEMILVSKQLTEAAKEPFPEEDAWCTIGDIRYGHPTAPLLLRYRTLMWMAAHPPDPRGERMCSRPAPYKVRLETQDLMDLFKVSQRTAERVIKQIREARERTGLRWVTVEEFCTLHHLDEDYIQKRLHEFFLMRWNKIKRNIDLDGDKK